MEFMKPIASVSPAYTSTSSGKHQKQLKFVAIRGAKLHKATKTDHGLRRTTGVWSPTLRRLLEFRGKRYFGSVRYSTPKAQSVRKAGDAFCPFIFPFLPYCSYLKVKRKTPHPERPADSSLERNLLTHRAGTVAEGHRGCGLPPLQERRCPKRSPVSQKGHQPRRGEDAGAASTCGPPSEARGRPGCLKGSPPPLPAPDSPGQEPGQRRLRAHYFSVDAHQRPFRRGGSWEL
ncbi:PREDICTED: uncharacterized protein LOC104023105 [Nipponia nippon]|uniref:uncharacterized protein LOC104023105 n=1 Tax=Nipponia nippon TaxID=128390 RepID=UPI000510D999|nr:PREDICTED: uncharacterized protein LOC104023105 [Nipponia nippon]